MAESSAEEEVHSNPRSLSEPESDELECRFQARKVIQPFSDPTFG